MIRFSTPRAAAAATLIGMAATFFPVSTFAFSDVKAGTQYSTAIDALAAKGVLKGYADGTFKSGQSITRGEFLKIILEARGTADLTGSNCFPDVKDEWFAKYFCTAKAEGIVSGYADGTAKPGQNITFVEASKVLSLAYKQKVESSGGEWYTPYTSALESAKAIPPTIGKLDALLTRGEMAEMMWRISEKKTDQPTKGVLNIQNPKLSINTASDAVQTAKTCADISAFGATLSTQSIGYGGGPLMMRDAVAPQAAPGAEMKSANSTAVMADHSTTNVQVEGVDEGDTVKTDGTYVYTVQNQNVYIVKSQPASAMKQVATIDFSKDNVTPQELYLNGDHLIVVGNAWNNGPVMPMSKIRGDMMIMRPYFMAQKEDIRVYNVTDPANPKLERTVRFDGNSVSTRMINDQLYMVLNESMQWNQPIPLDNVKEDQILPKFSDSTKGTAEMPVTTCAKIAILPHILSPAYLTVAVIPTTNLNADVKTKTIVGDAQNVYASLDNLYVASLQQNYVWDSAHPQQNEKTNFFRFAFTSDGIELKAQGSVPGHLLNQFAMDESGDTFRVATSIGNNWDPAASMSNSLFVTDMDLKTIGKVDGIAPGESIYAVRFIGNRAYVVTFKTVDPLFVIDLSDVHNPKILGKLKIPGYSSYLHPYDETHLIGFGKEVDESIDADKVHSDNAVYYTAVQGLKVAIFDVSDVNNPKEMYKTVIGDRGTDSPLLYDHHALLFDKSRNLLAFPVNVMEFLGAEKDKKPDEAMATQTFQGAYVYNISLDKGLTLRGQITHYTDEDKQKSGSYLWGKDITRILRLSESLVTLSQGGLQSHSLSDVKFENKVDFPATDARGPIMY